MPADATAPPPIAAPEPDAFAQGWTAFAVRRFDASSAVESVCDRLVEEAPVALYYGGPDGDPHAVLMATPTDLEAFAVGFTLSEGIAGSPDEIAGVDVAPTRHGLAVFISLAHPDAARLAASRRRLTAPGGCGLCGAEDLLHAGRTPPPLPNRLRLDPNAVTTALAELQRRQTLNHATGGAHAAACAAPDGTLHAVMEDAGRHNALDKLIGHCALRGVDLTGGFIAITSRASVELVQKAATLRCEALVAISAPTGLAVRAAQACGMSLLAFARGPRFTCYSAAQRIAAR